MKTRLFILTLITCFVFSDAYSQIKLENIAKKTGKSINKRVERGIDRGVDDVLDSAEDEVRGKNKKKKKKGEYSESSSPEVIVVREVSPFNFSGNLTVNIESNGWMEENLITVVTDDYQMAVRPMLVKKPNNLMIYDKETESVTKVNNEQYEGKALKEYHEYTPADPSDEDTEFEKTDEIQDMHGFIARKYILDGDGYRGHAWITAELDIDYDLFASLMELKELKLGNTYGFPLEMHVEFNNGDTYDYKVSNIDEGSPSKDLLDTSDYDLIDMTDLKSGN